MANCENIRTFKRIHYSLDIGTGEMRPQKAEWVTGPCDIRVFSEEGRRLRRCRSCRNGWEHPHNYPGQPRDASHVGPAN
jgi:hypothetical protein